MPAYEFNLTLPDGRVVATVSANVSVEERNAVRLERSSVPRSVRVGASGAGPTEGEQMLRSYRKLEEKHGSRVGQYLGEFTPRQIREAWKD